MTADWSIQQRSGFAFKASGVRAFDAALRSSLSRYAARHPERAYRRPDLRFIGRASAAVERLTSVPVDGQVGRRS